MDDLFDKYPEWVGMPEFNQQEKKAFKEIIVRFDSEQDYMDFQQKIKQKMTLKTKSIWHPFKSHWGLERKVYVDES
jgi:hypothetical protein